MDQRHQHQDRAEAAAFLRQALGLERVLDRLRRNGDRPVIKLRPAPGRAGHRAPNRTPSAA